MADNRITDTRSTSQNRDIKSGDRVEVVLEREGAAFNARGNVAFAGKMFLHESRIPLRTADLRTATDRQRDAGQGDLFDGVTLAADCEAGVCFT